MLVVAIQVAGFALAILALILFYAIGLNPAWFVGAFALHFLGDMLFIAAEGLPNMSFSDLLNKFEGAVKLPAWLTFVGLMGCAGTFIFVHSLPAKIVGFLCVGIALAGFAYEKIYP